MTLPESTRGTPPASRAAEQQAGAAPAPQDTRPVEAIVADLLVWCGNYFGNPAVFVGLCQELVLALAPPPASGTATRRPSD